MARAVRERGGRPDDGVAVRPERGEQDTELLRPALNTAELAPRGGAGIDRDGRRGQEKRRRTAVPASSRTAPLIARYQAGSPGPVLGSVDPVSCDATACSAPVV